MRRHIAALGVGLTLSLGACTQEKEPASTATHEGIKKSSANSGAPTQQALPIPNAGNVGVGEDQIAVGIVIGKKTSLAKAEGAMICEEVEPLVMCLPENNWEDYVGLKVGTVTLSICVRHPDSNEPTLLDTLGAGKFSEVQSLFPTKKGFLRALVRDPDTVTADQYRCVQEYAATQKAMNSATVMNLTTPTRITPFYVVGRS